MRPLFEFVTIYQPFLYFQGFDKVAEIAILGVLWYNVGLPTRNGGKAVRMASRALYEGM